MTKSTVPHNRLRYTSIYLPERYFCRFFQVIVITFSPEYNGVVNPPQSFTPQDLMTYEEAHRFASPAAYVTFQFGGQDFDKYQ